MWIGIKQNVYDKSYYISRNQDDAYVEDKVTVGLVLLAGSCKVCPGQSLLLSVKHLQSENQKLSNFCD